MKRCKKISCWTDYPFLELGDISGKKAQIRHVNVVAFDGNKYATVSVIGGQSVLSVKACYLYRHAGRSGHVKNVNFRKLERMIPASRLDRA